MQEALVYHVASGQAFFSGVALLLLALGLSLSLRSGSRCWSLCRTLIGCGGLALVAASATPLPAWLWGVALSLTAAWAFVERSRLTRQGLLRFRPWLRGGVVAVWGLAVAWELPYHLMPTLAPLGDQPLYVVGDSVSAGMGGEYETWPNRLGRLHGVLVHNLARAGANVRLARGQAALVREPRSLVLLEIGGNDLLGSTTSSDYERGLEALLTQLRARGRTIVMLELPLPPLFNRHGAIQRRLAHRHGAILVPKRVLLGVLTTRGATVDSIHLSKAGHELMSEAIWRVLRPAYQPS